jgi:hypothetical protein
MRRKRNENDLKAAALRMAAALLNFPFAKKQLKKKKFFPPLFCPSCCKADDMQSKADD